MMVLVVSFVFVVIVVGVNVLSEMVVPLVML